MAVRDDYRKRFEDYMRPSAAATALEAFLKKRSFRELVECLDEYFKTFEAFGRKNERSGFVFYRTTAVALDRGEVYFALRVDILVASTDRVWHERYNALTPKQQQALTKIIASKKRSLSPNQRAFLKLYHEHMSGDGKAQKDIEKFTTKLTQGNHYGPLQDCLRLYIEVSQGYKDGHKSRSVMIFFGLSHATIKASPPDFAATYQANVKEDGSVWKKRYDALDDRQRPFIDDDIRKKMTLYKDVEHKGKTYRVPTGKYEPGTVEAQKPAPGEQEPVEPTTAAQKEFAVILADLMRHRDAKRVKLFEGFLQRTNGEGLREAVIYFLRASEKKYPATDEQAKTIFLGLLSIAIAKNEAYYAFKVEALLAKAGTTWATRFVQLSDGQKGVIRSDITKKRKTCRFLDELKFAYYSQHGKDANASELRAFEPVYNPEQLDLLSKALSDVENASAPTVRDIERFSKALDTFSGVLRAQKDRLLMLVMIKRARERKGIRVELRYLLHLYGVGLFHQRLLDWRVLLYEKGFTIEERDYLITADERADRYFNDFVLQLEHVLYKKLGDAGVLATCKAQGALHLFAWRRDMRLVPMQEGAVLRALNESTWKTQADAIRKVAIPVGSQFGSGTVRINETIGDTIFVIWWNGQDTVYLQHKDTGDVVFEMSTTAFGTLWGNQKFYGGLYERTKHLLVLIPIIFEILGYLPDLITGGVTGLLKSIAFDIMFEKSVTAMGLDPTVAQLVFVAGGLAAVAGAPKSTATVEPDFSAIQQQSRARMTDHSGAGNTAIDVPLKGDPRVGAGNSGLGGGGGGHSGGSGGDLPRSSPDIDMRGDRLDDGRLAIRGDDTPSIGPKERWLDRGIPGDVYPSGTRIRGEGDAPPATGIDQLRAAEKHVDDVAKQVEHARKALDQTQHSQASLNDQLEIVTKPGFVSKDPELVNKLRDKQKQLKDIEAQEHAALQRLELELDSAKKSARSLGSTVLGEFNLADKPTTFRSGAVEVDSWHPSAYIGTTGDRDKVARLLRDNPNGPLSSALLDNNQQLFRADIGDTPFWQANPHIIELAHVYSRREGGREVFIVMSKARNREFGNRLERTGGVFKEDVIVIQGIAIDRMTAQQLVGRGGLTADMVNKAPVLKLTK